MGRKSIGGLLIAGLALAGWAWQTWHSPVSKKEAAETPASHPIPSPSASATQAKDPTPAAPSVEVTSPTLPADEQEAPELERAATVGQLRLEGPGGEAVYGFVQLIEANQTFLDYMASMARIGEALYYDSILQEAELTESAPTLAITSEANQADFVIVSAPGYAPYLDAWKPIADDEEKTLQLELAKPIAVTVLTADGQPIQDAEVWYRWRGIFDQNEKAPLLDRFRPRFFQDVVVTDAQGKAVITSTFPEDANELFVRPGDLWATQVVTGVAGKPIEIRCPDAFMITGTVLANGKPPEQEVFLKVTIHRGDQYWIMEGGRVKEEGKYKVTGIATGYPTYSIEALGQGYASVTREILSPAPGSTVHLDFALEQGCGGTIQIQDPWGHPIANGRIKFVAEGERNHMYGYNTQADGKVILPNCFSKHDNWWLNLRIGDNLYFRLPNLYHCGDSVSITLPNLAKITGIRIANALLGDATVKHVRWQGRSSQSWGTVDGLPSNEQPLLVASGAGSLQITLSDGRSFQQNLTLTPGWLGAVELSCQPATLRMELPADPPAYVEITDQNNALVFAQENLSGPVSIPLWRGNFGMVVIWPEQTREIPLISIRKQVLDLGKIEAANDGLVHGIVKDSNNQPVQWANLYLTSSNGFSSQNFITEEDGAFSFQNVPLGAYYLLCDTADSHGLEGTTWMQSLNLTADAPEKDLVVQLPVGESHQVAVETDLSWGCNAFAILATPSASAHAPIRSQGPTYLAAQAQNGWLGVAQILDGQTRAQAIEIPAGSGNYQMPAASFRHLDISFVDEQEQAWDSLLLRLQLFGHPCTRRLTLDSNGHLQLEVDRVAPWSIQVAAPSGLVRNYALAELEEHQTLVIPRAEEGSELAVINESGRPIPWPVLQSVDGAVVIPSNAKGFARIPDDYQRPLVISAPGYMPSWLENPHQSTAVLPQRLDHIQVQVPTNTTKLQWQTNSPIVSLWQPEMPVRPGQTTVSLPPFHPAHFTFTAYDANGALLATTEASISKNGQTVVMR